MTSQLNVDTIVDKAGSGGSNVKMANTSTYVSDGGAVSQNTVQGLAKAWMVFNQDTLNIDSSFNTSSVTDDNTGQYDQVYINGFTGTKNHCTIPTSQNESVNTDSKDYPIEARHTSSKNGINTVEGNTTRDKGFNHIVVTGDLA